MPRTEVVLFTEADGSCPLLNWLDGLPSKVQDKCIVRVERLAEIDDFAKSHQCAPSGAPKTMAGIVSHCFVRKVKITLFTFRGAKSQ